MLNHAGLENGERSGIWAECARTITFLSNITASKTKEKYPYQLLFGSKPKLPSSFRIFGEIGVVTTKDNVQGKLKNRGTACIFMGYSVDHANDVYQMFNFNTKRIIHSRDVVWLGKSYKNWMITNVPSKEEYDDGYVHTIATFNQEANYPERIQVIQDKDQNIKSKVYRQLKQLESSFNPEASKIVKDIEQGRDIILDQANIALFSGNIQAESTTFDQLGIMLTPRTEIIGELQSRKRLTI
jgi:hypothetical protein